MWPLHNRRQLLEREELMLMRLRNSVMGVGLAAFAVIAAAGVVEAAGTSITQCGTVISTPGNYVISQSLTSTSNTVDCIDIDSPAVVLQLANNVSLSGPGGAAVTAAGIKIAKGADGLQLNIQSDTIQGFGIGIDEEASAVSISALNSEVTGNAAQGILIQGANSVLLQSVNSEKNGAAGLELLHSSGVIVQGVPNLQQNGGYGLWLRSSSGNYFFNLESASNTLSGIYVGESAADRLGSTKKKKLGARDNEPSNDNVFSNSAAIANGGAGFAIDLGDSHNVVNTCTAQSNTDSDAFDGNKDCDHNSWTDDFFSTTNAACIH
jgi:hypothetical protein